MCRTNDKPLLILDLDETLIHASDTALRVAHDFIVGPYFVYNRPFLGDFLRTVSDGYQIAVWSSSSTDYVAGICANIIPAGMQLQFAWSRTRCTQRYDPEWQTQYWIKDLRKVKRLGYDLKQTIIVDDTPRKLERNYGNAVYVSSFEGHAEDDELERLAPYLMSLVGADDFRTIEKRGWRSRD